MAGSFVPMIVILQQQISENAEPDAIIFFMKSETYFDANWLAKM